MGRGTAIERSPAGPHPDNTHITLQTLTMRHASARSPTMSRERLKRLAALESRLLRPKFVAFDYAAAARATVALLAWFDENRKAVRSGRASLLPIRPDTTSWRRSLCSARSTTG